MEPTEGTMLTVVRCATEYISGKAATNPEQMLNDYLAEAQRTLKNTPNMLHVLKKAGVVDSGGAGLVYILEGALRAFNEDENFSVLSNVERQEQNIDLSLFTEDSIPEYGYCTELLLRLQCCKTDPNSFEVSTFTEYLKGIGDSVVAFKTGSIVKIHIHTMTPDKVLGFCQQYGEFSKIKIENMSLQHNNTVLDGINISVKPKSEHKPYGVVAVACGNGIKKLFSEHGADVIVEGGQTMNPSAEDFLEAFEKANADTIFVLPNNSNIILTAKQAAGMYKASDVRVIESRTIGDGYASLSVFCADSGNAEQITDEPNSAMQGVITADISQSVRNTEKTRAGDYIGFVGKEIIAADKSRFNTACATVDGLDIDSHEICLLIRGDQADETEAQELAEYIRIRHPETEVFVIDGLQKIYDYILILE